MLTARQVTWGASSAAIYLQAKPRPQVPRSGRCLNCTAPVAMQPLLRDTLGGILSCLPGSHLEIRGSTLPSSTARLGSIWWPSSKLIFCTRLVRSAVTLQPRYCSGDPARTAPRGLMAVWLVWQLSTITCPRWSWQHPVSAHSGLAQRASWDTLGAGLVGFLCLIYHFSIGMASRREPPGILPPSDFGIASRCGDAAHRAYQRECNAGGFYLARPHRNITMPSQVALRFVECVPSIWIRRSTCLQRWLLLSAAR